MSSGPASGDLLSGNYIINKYYPFIHSGEVQAEGKEVLIAEGDVILALGADPKKRKVVMTRPPIRPTGWELAHKEGNRYIMVLEGGVASKIGDENLVYTTVDNHVPQEWELHSVLTKGKNVYYIRSAEAKQAWVLTEDRPSVEQQVMLEDLGDIVIPEGPPDKFLFVLERVLQ